MTHLTSAVADIDTLPDKLRLVGCASNQIQLSMDAKTAFALARRLDEVRRLIDRWDEIEAEFNGKRRDLARSARALTRSVIWLAVSSFAGGAICGLIVVGSMS